MRMRMRMPPCKLAPAFERETDCALRARSEHRRHQTLISRRLTNRYRAGTDEAPAAAVSLRIRSHAAALEGGPAIETAVPLFDATELTKFKEDARIIIKHESLQQALEGALQTLQTRRAATRVHWLQQRVHELVTSKQARCDTCGGRP